ncbi:hypothetical protein [Cupriavidus basilensis]|uniref:hypothetical protein n=1 Tax=Cupriavidus basilensis TaxID=68895 RepID=UPI0039F6AB60
MPNDATRWRQWQQWLGYWFPWRQSGSTAVSLRVTDGNGDCLVDVAGAERHEYRMRIGLPSGAIVVNLYGRYLAFVDDGGHHNYDGIDFACRTYVKFGECLQDRQALHISIRSMRRAWWRRGN